MTYKPGGNPFPFKQARKNAMTKEPLFIISGEQLDRALAYRVRVLPFMQPNERGEWERFIASCRSRPYNEQEIRQSERKEVYDELGVLHGEGARVFNEYLNDPEIHSTPESQEIIARARELAKKQTGCPYWNPEKNNDPDDPENHCMCRFSEIRQAAINGVLDKIENNCNSMKASAQKSKGNDRLHRDLLWDGMITGYEDVIALINDDLRQQSGTAKEAK